MAKPLVSDELWAVIGPLLPPEPPKPKGGRPRIDNCKALTGNVFILRSGAPWETLPKEIGLRERHDLLAAARRAARGRCVGYLHQALRDRLGQADDIDWEPAWVDSASVPAPRGAETGPNPTDCGKSGSKRHVMVDGNGTPLAVKRSQYRRIAQMGRGMADPERN